MTPRRRIFLTSIVASSSAIATAGILGAISVPTGFNIAAALIIGVGALVETPLVAMAVAKHHKHHPH
jgi:hypothetical protein